MKIYLTFLILFVSLFAKAQESDYGSCFGLSYSGNYLSNRNNYDDIISPSWRIFYDSIYWSSFKLKSTVDGYYKELLDSTHIKMEGEIKNGERTGMWKFYKTTENKVRSCYCIINFRNNIKQGEVKRYFFENNDTTYFSDGFYENDKFNGLHTFYKKVENKWIKNSELNLKNGLFLRQQLNHQAGIGNYINDTLDGAYVEYNYDGDTSKLIISDIKLKKRTEIGYFSNGKIEYISHSLYNTINNNNNDNKNKYSYSYSMIDNLVKDGEQIDYYENGEIQKIENYNNGKKNGEQIEYYEKGKIKAMSKYVNGDEDGWDIEFSEKGDTTYKAFYVNDKIEGQEVEYSDNGKTKSIVYYKNDKINGQNIKYNTKKVFFIFNKTYTSSIKNYKDDELEGDCKFYNTKGKLKKEVIFKNDIPYTSVSAYDNKGNKLDQGTLVNGTGIFKEYYSDGKLQNILTFKNSACYGEFNVYNEEGKLEQTGIIYNYNDTINSNSFKGDFYIKGSAIYNNVRKIYPYGNVTIYNIYANNKLPVKNRKRFKKYYYDNYHDYDNYDFYNEYNLVVKREINYDTITKTSTIKKYYSNGNLYSMQKENRDSSKIIKYYENGKEKYSGQYAYKTVKHSDCPREGDWVSYYPSGKIKSVEKYKDNELNDINKYYDESGELKRTLYSVNDSCYYSIFNGDTINYMWNWQKNGKWMGLPANSSGEGCNDNPNTVEYYNNGKPCGTWLYSNDTNVLKEKYVWIDSSFAYCYYYNPANGKVIIEGKVFKLRDRFGSWKFYDYKTGELKLEGNFNDNKPSGVWKIYNKGTVEKSIASKDLETLLKNKKLLKTIVLDNNYIYIINPKYKTSKYNTVIRRNGDYIKYGNSRRGCCF